MTPLEAFLADLAWIEKHVWILDRSGKRIRLRFNRAQRTVIAACVRQLAADQPIRVIVLKARQLGISTFWMALAFARSRRRRGVRSMVLTHRAKETRNLWGMVSTFVDHTRGIRTAKKARYGIRRFARVWGPLLWWHDSQIRCETAGGSGVGRSGTLQFLHLSEMAQYGRGKTPEQQAEIKESLAGIRASMARTPDSVEAIESTAQGVGGTFYDEWQRAESGESNYAAIFIAWFEEESYTAPRGTCGLRTARDLTRYERSLRKRFGLSLEQLAWRRAVIADQFGGDERLFRQEYPSTPEEAFLVSGANVFDPDILAAYLAGVTAPIWRGDLHYDPPAGWVPEKRDDGPVSIWRMPRKGEPFVCFADVAECLDTGSDRDAAVVRSGRDWAIVAQAVGHWDEGTWARKLAALAWMYNQALLAVERNATGTAVIGALRGKLGGEAMYRRLYRFKRIDQITGKRQTVYGFRTDVVSKRTAVEAEKRLLREAQEICPSVDVLREMSTFIDAGRGKMEAAAGARDDLVIAAIGSAFLVPEVAAEYYAEAIRKGAKLDELLSRSATSDEPAENVFFENLLGS